MSCSHPIPPHPLLCNFYRKVRYILHSTLHLLQALPGTALSALPVAAFAFFELVVSAFAAVLAFPALGVGSFFPFLAGAGLAVAGAFLFGGISYLVLQLFTLDTPRGHIDLLCNVWWPANIRSCDWNARPYDTFKKAIFEFEWQLLWVVSI